MTAQQDNPKLTITLTGRRPVSIIKDDWPIIAEANDRESSSEIEAQANRVSRWSIKVRQHADNRAIVYASYSHDNHSPNARQYNVRGGELLDRDPTDLAKVIRRVGEWMAQQEHDNGDESRWQELIHACIAHLPAEEIA